MVKDTENLFYKGKKERGERERGERGEREIRKGIKTQNNPQPLKIFLCVRGIPLVLIFIAFLNA